MIPGCEEKLFSLYFGYTRGELSGDTKSTVVSDDFVIKNIPCSLKIVIMCLFCGLSRQIQRKSVKKNLFLLFQKNADVSIFV